MLTKINEQNFEAEVLNNPNTVLIDFYAEWCGPCKMMSPVIDEIAAKHPEITVSKINAEENYNLGMKYNVVSIPTIIIFKNGVETERFIGYTPKEVILNKLA